jgi:hypothetical protein
MFYCGKAIHVYRREDKAFQTSSGHATWWIPSRCDSSAIAHHLSGWIFGNPKTGKATRETAGFAN